MHNPEEEIVSSTATVDSESSTESANSFETPEDEAIEVPVDFTGPDAEAQQRAEIEAALVRCGLTGHTLTLATLRIEALFHRMIMTAAGEGLAEVLAALGKSAFAHAIRRVINRDSRPLREAAREIGCHPEALRRAEAKLRELLKV